MENTDSYEMYKIYINNTLADQTEKKGIAFVKYETALLLSKNVNLIKCIAGSDQVTDGIFTWNDDLNCFEYGFNIKQRPIPADSTNTDAPNCSENCSYMQIYNDFDLQRNALRSEMASLISEKRCGWNLLPNRIGGMPLDYAPCTFVKDKLTG